MFIIKGLWQGAQGVAGLAEITSSLLSIYLTYTTNSCNDYKNQVNQNINDANPQGQLPDDTNESAEFKRCKEIDQILFWIQIGSLGLDLLASKMIKKHAKKLEDLGYPASWDIGDYLQLKQKFQGINAAGLDNFQNFINQIPVAYRANVETKLLNDFDIDQRMLFLDDFADDALRNDEFWQKMMNNGGEVMDNWKLMLVNNISSERKIFEYLNNTNLTNYLIRYYGDNSLKAILKKIDEVEKQKFLSQFGNISPLRFQKMIDETEKLHLCIDYQNIRFTTREVLSEFDVLQLISSNLKNKHIGVIRFAKNLNWADVLKNYKRNINFKAIDKNQLQEIFNRNLGLTTQSKIDDLMSKNRIFSTTEVYNGNTLVGQPQNEIFISGTKSSNENLFRNSTGQINYTSPSYNGKTYNVVNQDFNHIDFQEFARKAFDKKGKARLNDTELKYVFNFLENHWHLGNRFKIKMESTLYNCTSCQRYMQALKEYGSKHGKTIEIEFLAHPGASDIKEANKIINL